MYLSFVEDDLGFSDHDWLLGSAFEYISYILLSFKKVKEDTRDKNKGNLCTFAKIEVLKSLCFLKPLLSLQTVNQKHIALLG